MGGSEVSTSLVKCSEVQCSEGLSVSNIIRNIQII
jgi:hypothetical protein